jgi:hypothetical protein
VLPAELPPPSPGSPTQANDAQDWQRQDWEDQDWEAPAGQTVPKPVARLLDANLDRAREGLRVLEDWARFGLDRPDLVVRTKDLRQRLARVHRDRYKQARHTATDPAAGLSHPAQAERVSPARVVAANAARVQEALRVLEEFGRSLDPALAREAARSRYALYDLELELMRAGRDGDGRRQLLARCRLYLICGAGAAAAVEGALEAGVGIVASASATLPCSWSMTGWIWPWRWTPTGCIWVRGICRWRWRAGCWVPTA